MSAKTPYLIVVALVLALGGAWYWFGYSRLASEPVVRLKPPEPAPAVVGPPPVRYPLTLAEASEQAAADSAPATESQEPAGPPAPLPALDASDAELRADLGRTVDATLLDRLFLPDQWVRRFVVTIDNLTGPKLPSRYLATRPLPDPFVTDGEDDTLVIGAANARRYEPFVRLIESVDVTALVALYTRYYPLFQAAFDDLGYPGVYFNDRLVDVIDHLLAAPEVELPIRLVRPRVLYRYADPKLESLSSGQKVLVRMGPDNARRIKARLRDLRAALTRHEGT